MPSQFSLFDPPANPFRDRLAERLAHLASQGIFFGASSWKYPGWMGQIYTPERYRVRGTFSEKRFNETCLAEYAEVFPIVCGDFSFYQFPSPQFWSKLFGSSPGPLQFAFKVPEEITVRAWPSHARYGDRAGLENPGFLDAALLQAQFLDLLEPYRSRVAVLIFEFGTFSRSQFDSVEPFVSALDRFLGALPTGWLYSVEVRNPEFLKSRYLDCLRGHGVAHVFNAWTRMPDLGTQLRIPGVETAGFTVTRALLRQGRSYEQAVAGFQPYDRVQEIYPRARDALRQIIHSARDSRKKAFVFVNNRLEGNAPSTIEAVTGD